MPDEQDKRGAATKSPIREATDAAKRDVSLVLRDKRGAVDEPPDMNNLRCSICRTKIEGKMIGTGDGTGHSFAHAECYWRKQADALRAEVERLRDLVKRRHRKPTHGPCCTCQRCGLDHDSCRCSLDDAVDEADTLRARVRELEEGLRPFARAGEAVAKVGSKPGWNLWVQSHGDPGKDVKISYDDVMRARALLEWGGE